MKKLMGHVLNMQPNPRHRFTQPLFDKEQILRLMTMIRLEKPVSMRNHKKTLANYLKKYVFGLMESIIPKRYTAFLALAQNNIKVLCRRQ